MRPMHLSPAILMAFLVTGSTPLLAQQQPSTPKAIYDKAAPVFAVVQFVYDSEAGRREIAAAAIAITPEIVVLPGHAIPSYPESQLKEFKIIIPKAGAEPEELDATYLGEDERWRLAFVRLKDPARKLPATLTFVDKPLNVGDPVYSVCILPKSYGYHPVLCVGTTSAVIHSSVQIAVVSGDLAEGGAAVFNQSGEAIGLVQSWSGAYPWLEPSRPKDYPTESHAFVPASEILPALAVLPTGNKWPPLPFTGIMSLNDLSKDLTEVYGLVGKFAVEIGDVVPNSPAASVGLQKGMVITEVDGIALQRGDVPHTVGLIIQENIQRFKKPGETLAFSVIPRKGEAPKTFKLTLGERPAEARTAARFYAEDLGFTVRDAVFSDRYYRKLSEETKGVVTDFLKPGSSALSAKLAKQDFITQFNGQPVTDVATFKAAYEAFRKEKPRDAIVLQLLREGNTQIIRVEPPQ